MAKAPFTQGRAPDLLSGAANPVAGLLPELSFAGVNTEAEVIVAGGAKHTDNSTVNAVIDANNQNDGDDDYVDSVVAYTETGSSVSRSTLNSLSDSREFMEIAPILNCVLLAGGQDEKGYSRVVERYDSFGGHKILDPLDTPRTDMASAHIGDNILFAGGDDGSGATNKIDIYGINFFKKMSGLALPVAVKGLCGCTFGRYAVFAGGRTANGLPSDQVIAFDQHLNIISNIEPLSEARYNLSAAVCTNPDDSSESYLLIAGGKSTHTGFSTTVDVYDSNLKKVAAGLELSVGRSRLKGASCQGYAFFMGGVIGTEPQDTPSDIVDVFNWKLNRLETMKLSEAKNSLSVASFDDRILAAGGYNMQGLSKTVDMFTWNGATGYATVTFKWPSALVSYEFGD